METSPEIVVQGITADARLRDAIDRHVASLEERYGRVTACRVVIKGPGGHHRTGGLHEITIHLTLPDGREVNIGRTRNDDERHSDLSFALNDAFKRARRQLQDKTRRMKGEVKNHDGPPLGTVTHLEPVDGYGFIEANDGRELYFHRNSVLGGAFAQLDVGTRVSFAEEVGDKGPQASTVKILGKHGLR